MLNTTNGSESLTSSSINWKATPTITQTSVFFTLAFITVVGNGLVIIAVVVDPLKELRTVSNYLVVNLAIADFLLGLIAEPLWGMTLWIYSKKYHVAAMSVIIVSTNTTALTVLAMRVERYVRKSRIHLYTNGKMSLSKLLQSKEAPKILCKVRIPKQRG